MVALKFKLNGEIRRISCENMKLSFLLEAAQDLFKDSLPPFYLLKYTDEDGDLVTILSDQDLEEAVRHSSANGTLTISIVTCAEQAYISQEVAPESQFSLPTPCREEKEETQQSTIDQILSTLSNFKEEASSELFKLFQNLGVQSHEVFVQVLTQVPQKYEEATQFLANLAESVKTNPQLKQVTEQISTVSKDVLSSFKGEEPIASSSHQGVEHPVYCDSCDEVVYGIRYKCSICHDFDLCEKCERIPNVHTFNHAFLKIKNPKWAAPSASSSYLQTPRAKFIADITIPDGMTVEPEAKLNKIWRVKNKGSTAWPSSVFLVHIGGAKLTNSDSFKLEYDVQPDQEVELSLPITAPKTPGRYISFMRLQLPNGTFFGDRLWTDIVVTAPAPAPIPAPAVQPSEEKLLPSGISESYRASLLKLRSMGFEISEICRVAVKHNGVFEDMLEDLLEEMMH